MKLLSALKPNTPSWDEAAFALGQIQNANAIPTLETVLNDLSLHPIVCQKDPKPIVSQNYEVVLSMLKFERSGKSFEVIQVEQKLNKISLVIEHKFSRLNVILGDQKLSYLKGIKKKINIIYKEAKVEFSNYWFWGPGPTRAPETTLGGSYLVRGFEDSGKKSLSFPLSGKHKFLKYFPDIRKSKG
ncbi:hypothetical protein LguiB_030686 [Lonicera macranthoides]